MISISPGLRIQGPGRLEASHGDIGHTREIGRQFGGGVPAERNPAPGQHGCKISVLEQHVRPGCPDPLLANDRVIVGCRKESCAGNSTRQVLDGQKVMSPSLKHSVHKRGLTSGTSERTSATCVACSSPSLLLPTKTSFNAPVL